MWWKSSLFLEWIAKRETLFQLFLFEVDIFISSILSSSANCERAFSRMGRMVANRRAAITADNAEKRLTLCNQLPQKWRQSFARNKKLSEQSWMKNYSNKSSIISLSCWVLSFSKIYLKFWFWFLYFGLNPQKNSHSDVRVKSYPHVNRTRTRTREPPPRTAPTPHPHTGVWYDHWGISGGFRDIKPHSLSFLTILKQSNYFFKIELSTLKTLFLQKWALRSCKCSKYEVIWKSNLFFNFCRMNKLFEFWMRQQTIFWVVKDCSKTSRKGVLIVIWRFGEFSHPTTHFYPPLI